MAKNVLKIVFQGNFTEEVRSTTPMTEIVDTDDESAVDIGSISTAPCSVVCHFPLLIAGMCFTKCIPYFVY